MQEKRSVAVHSPLGDDVLLLRSMSGHEELGRAFKFELELLTTEEEIDFNKLIGESMSLRMTLRNDEERWWSGVCTEFSHAGTSGRYNWYRATLRPWFWLLTQTADCRIFPDKNAGMPAEMTAPEIIMELLREFGMTDFKDNLQRKDYRTRDFCVQYRESAFDFISRLMEEEGIYYYFTHEDGKHTLVFADDASSHEVFPGYDEVVFYPPTKNKVREEENLESWSVSKQLRTGTIALQDFDFERPSSDLRVSLADPQGHTHDDLEIYDYPGKYTEERPVDQGYAEGDIESYGKGYATNRLQEMMAGYEICRGAGDVKGLCAGSLFSLTGYPVEAQNREYLLVRSDYQLESDDYESSDGAPEFSFHCEIRCIESKRPFRPERITRVPRVAGPQTATVVGKAGEKTWTDAYGRVLVQFPWDRCGVQDENSSCWVRVSQGWAGKNWGAMFIPHLGQEVIVEFLEGDPDQPIITGRVYNKENMPPFELPKTQTVSGIRDDFGNEIAFDATPGDEHLYLYSPHHNSRFILGRSTETITNSDGRSFTFGNTDKYTGGNADSTTYGSTRSFFFGDKFSYTQGCATSIGVGTSISGFAGMSVGVTVGGSLALKASWSYSWGASRVIDKNKAKYVRASGDDIKLDSEKEVWLCGGANDASIVKCSKDELSLAFGAGSRKTPFDPAPIGMVASAVATGVATAASIQSSRNAAVDDYISQSDNPNRATTNPMEWTQKETVGSCDVDHIAIGAAAVAGLGLIGALWPSEAADPKHTTHHTKVSLKENMVLISADKSMMTVEKNGHVKILAEKDISLNTTGDVLFKKAVKISESAFKISKVKIDHKNLKVSK